MKQGIMLKELQRKERLVSVDQPQSDWTDAMTLQQGAADNLVAFQYFYTAILPEQLYSLLATSAVVMTSELEIANAELAEVLG
jgi:hypothetical protein